MTRLWRVGRWMLAAVVVAWIVWQATEILQGAPGIVLTRIAIGLVDLGAVLLGATVLVVAVAMQVAATSSVHTVALATKLNVAAVHGAGDRAP